MDDSSETIADDSNSMEEGNIQMVFIDDSSENEQAMHADDDRTRVKQLDEIAQIFGVDSVAEQIENVRFGGEPEKVAHVSVIKKFEKEVTSSIGESSKNVETNNENMSDEVELIEEQAEPTEIEQRDGILKDILDEIITNAVKLGEASRSNSRNSTRQSPEKVRYLIPLSLLGTVSRTGRVIKRKMLVDSVPGFELDSEPSENDTVTIRKTPRIKINPMRPKPQRIDLAKSVSVKPTGSTSIRKPNEEKPQQVRSTVLVRSPQAPPPKPDLRRPRISLRKDLIDPKANTAGYNSETDNDEDLPKLPYRRRVCDDYLRSKYRILPSFICIHDLNEYRGMRILALKRQLLRCKKCKEFLRKPSPPEMFKNWFKVVDKILTPHPPPTIKPVENPRTRIREEEVEEIPVVSFDAVDKDRTKVFINPCRDTDPITIMIKVTYKDTSSSFVMNRPAYATFAKNINAAAKEVKAKRTRWPTMPLDPLGLVELSFPGYLDWQNHLPKVGPMTPQQKTNLMKSLNSAAKSTASKELKELIKKVEDSDVTITPPSAKSKMAVNTKLQCCVHCSKVYRASETHVCKATKTCTTCKQVYLITSGHKCPKGGKPTLTPKARSIKAANIEKLKSGIVPSERLKMCTACEVVYSESEKHTCSSSKKAAKKAAPKKEKKNITYSLCQVCMKIFKEGEDHGCGKKKENESGGPPAKRGKRPNVMNFLSPGDPFSRESTPEKENIPDIEPLLPDETPFTTTCPNCKVLYQSNETHKCGEKNENLVYSVLCDSCSQLYNSNEAHICKAPSISTLLDDPPPPQKILTLPASPVRPPIKSNVAPKPSEVFTAPKPIEVCTVPKPRKSSAPPKPSEVFSLPNLDGSLPEIIRAPKPLPKVIQSRECMACAKTYAIDFFNGHQCRPLRHSKVFFCRGCCDYISRDINHICGLEEAMGLPVPQRKVVVERKSVKCDMCNLLVESLDNHICQKKPKTLTYKCSSCPFTSESKKAFTEHSCLEKVDNFYRCSDCPKMFSEMMFLQKHQQNMCPKRIVKCNNCFSPIKFDESQKCPCRRSSRYAY